MHDLAIIGGGPAAIAAGVYAARKHLKTIFIAEAIGGQSIDSQDIQNWIGTPHIAGMAFQKTLESHLREYAGDIVDIKLGERVQKVEKTPDGFSITTPTASFEVRAVLIATGGSRKKLEATGALEFENKGVTYCASCDGPLFSGMDVAVVGGGNAGFETAAQLLAYSKSVTLVHRSPEFEKADKATVEAVLAHPNMKVLKNTEPTEVKGDGFVNALVVKNKQTGEETTLPVSGVFVEIGMIAATDLVKGLVELDEWGRVKVDGKSQRAYLLQTPTTVSGARRGENDEGGVPLGTMTESQGPRNKADEAGGGVWAAGDCSDGLYHQNNIAAGDAVKALEDIYFWLRASKK
ncbi:FAD-dependent oxidoreductase [Acetobacteraceae bacterium]|nr:FAD-dependent oxidoreductase [Candidatus Parcubacteria bacterium]